MPARSAPHRIRALVALLVAVVALVAAGPAAAAAPTADEVALAERYAPVVRLPGQPRECADGAPYQPMDVDRLMGNPEVALRGPWDTTSIVTVAPTAKDLSRGLPGYHLDFPGDALRPGCTYEEWAARLNAQSGPTTYGRVVTQAGVPGRLALQYWFFYVYNDWKNTHEGDWEMIQLVFDAATPAAALRRRPVEVGYSQHSSAERARWGDPKLEIDGGTHPVVYPAQGSGANFFGSHLYLMRTSAEGVGCDDTRNPARTVRPRVAVVPTAAADYLPAYPWLGFDGRWGERQAAFFDGPTGPNDKLQWTEPFTWADTVWRDASFTVPSSGALGTAATDFFCTVVGAGSTLLRRALANPAPTLLAVSGVLLLLAWALSRTRWVPAAPLPASRRRAWGQLVASGGRMYRRHPRLFLGIGLLFVPLGILITLLQWLVFRVGYLAPLVDEAGERNAFVAVLALGLGAVITLLGLAVVQAAVAHAVAELDAGRPVTALSAYAWVLRERLRSLLLALLVAAVVQLVLDLTVVLLPVAVLVLVRWSLLGAVAGVERGPRGTALLRRSGTLARGHWWRVASVVIGVTGVALLIGPAVGVLVLLVTGAAFNLVNLIAALVYVAAMPFAALVVSYLYFDLRVREEAVAVDLAAEEAGGAAPAA